MNNPLVSIIVPCYNQAQYLDETLMSVLNQTYAKWECIIVNDGSPDETEIIAQKWVAKDSRFKYVYKENGGLSSARNFGLNIAKGDYIQFLDSDDYIAGAKLEFSLQQLDSSKSEETKVVVSNFRMFVNTPDNTSAPYCNLNSQLLNFENLLYQWDELFTIPIHCGLFDSFLFKNFRFPEQIKAKEDWVMWVSIFYKDCKAIFINEPLALYRKNPDSITRTKNMFPDFIKACEYFRNYLTEDEFYKLSIILISRYNQLNDDLKFKLNTIKKSKIYQTGLLIKFFLKYLGVLKLFKNLFPFVLKLKSKLG